MNNVLDSYKQTFDLLKRHMKWKVSDKRILMTISSIYVLNQETLDVDRFLQLADAIKKNAGLFSSIRSHPRFTTAAMLDVKLERPEDKVDQLHVLYDLFRKARFGSSVFTYIAATILHAKEIYDDMKREHAFLTTSSDYPMATILALENRTGIIQHIEDFYNELPKHGFRKGNDLQFLSHILALNTAAPKHVLISRVIHVMDSFVQAHIKAKQMYYPIIGMLALLPPEEYDIRPLLSLYEELNSEKEFKWYKDINLILAASFFMNEKIDKNGLAETSLNTILEAILQAQQAVMIATVTATAAASSNNSGN
ncbi:DUF4003 family protein [Ornithinibacillus sp. FSL M8-0202]|uniref:DUF4003 family protein n=1 Tax=Ornithinibacillus sp. FSL M8-0202 TaxID=2921616 RepID=UPI0030D2B528